jgi:hypothetical protein
MSKVKKEKERYVKLYVPELKQLVEGSDEKMCLMMAQLEYWFGIKPDGFYKFMERPKGVNPAYREGDSWTEEMGMSNSKIETALKPICTHYSSWTEYKQADDKFQGRLYCSYYHRPSHQTYYLRNHEKVNAELARLELAKLSHIFGEKHSSNVGKGEIYTSGNGVIDNAEIIESEVVYTENNSEINSKNKQEREEGSHFGGEVKEKREEEIPANSDNFDSSYSGDLVTAEIPAWQQRQNRKVPFPAGFELTEDMIAWAKENNPEIDVHHSTEKFRVYNYDNFSADWLREWQMWILREKPISKAPAFDANQYRLDIYADIDNWFKKPKVDEPVTSSLQKPEPKDTKADDERRKAEIDAYFKNGGNRNKSTSP